MLALPAASPGARMAAAQTLNYSDGGVYVVSGELWGARHLPLHCALLEALL